MRQHLRFYLLTCMILLFTLGFAAGLIIPKALMTSPNIQQTLSEQKYQPKISSPEELPSPKDRIREDQIHVYANRIIIDLRDAEWATFTDTNSMDPVIDYGANAIEIIPKNANEIQPGDIVSYRSTYAEGVIIHRVQEIGHDEKGWFAKLKGDNNPSSDPGKIRFNQIERVVVAIIY